MAAEKIHIQEFISMSADYPVLDVRSPGEFIHAHIPGAHSLPLFTDQERAVVGTLYKQEGREAAIRTGLDYFGVKMRRMVEEIAQQYSALIPKGSSFNDSSSAKPILVHCWRGGMRSAGVAWLLDLYGFKVYTLAGGYKTFRSWVFDQFSDPGPIHILGGYTGSGKTDLLHHIQAKEKSTVIDLEGLANHKGSAFGAIGLEAQPSQEMFENKLALAIFRIRQTRLNNANVYPNKYNPGNPVWMEDESQRIGSVNIPASLWEIMRKAPVYFLDIPFEERLKYLTDTYGKLNKGDLAAAITRIQKRLGGLETKTSLGNLVEGNISGCFDILLKYYDKKYKKSLLNREDADQLIHMVPCEKVDQKNNYRNLGALLKPLYGNRSEN
jgi:tRNA 2-selenouridine synthase